MCSCSEGPRRADAFFLVERTCLFLLRPPGAPPLPLLCHICRSPLRRMSAATLFLLLGFFSATSAATIIGSVADWDPLAAGKWGCHGSTQVPLDGVAVRSLSHGARHFMVVGAVCLPGGVFTPTARGETWGPGGKRHDARAGARGGDHAYRGWRWACDAGHSLTRPSSFPCTMDCHAALRFSP